MRLTQQALASLTALLVFASCVTPPPPLPDPGEDYATSYREAPAALRASYSQDRYGDDRYGYDRPNEDRYEGPAYEERYENRYDRDRYSPPPTSRFALMVGGRRMEEEGFGAADEPGVFGIEYSTVPDLGGIGFEFGLNFGYDSEDDTPGSFFNPGTPVDHELSTAEIYAGLRAEFGQGPVRPYIGGGGTFLSMNRLERQGNIEREEDDSALGAYVHGGIQADLNENFFIGIDYRHVFGGTYEFGAVEVDGDYNQLAFTLGFNL